MIRLAREMDLLTCPYVLNADEARAMAEAGADMLVPHIGLTTKGMIGARTGLTLEEASAGAGWRCRRGRIPDMLCLCHGGPIAEPDDVGRVFPRRAGSSGSSGRAASSGCRPSWR